jgi:hypothetical protein
MWGRIVWQAGENETIGEYVRMRGTLRIDESFTSAQNDGRRRKGTELRVCAVVPSLTVRWSAGTHPQDDFSRDGPMAGCHTGKTAKVHSEPLSRLPGLGGPALRGGGIVRRIVPIAKVNDVRTGRRPGVASSTSSSRSTACGT